MVSRRRLFLSTVLGVVAVSLLAALATARTRLPRVVPPDAGPRLRISNASAVPIDHLVVRFPDEPIVFGAVPAGATTAYRSVPHGVFAYAAYEAMINGRTIAQGVDDWVGEQPLPGNSFTYELTIDLTQPDWSMIASTVRIDN